jgi:hypothetical protein
MVPAFHDPERLRSSSSSDESEPRADCLLTVVKVEHTRERHGAPHAGVSSACAGHRRPRAAEHRLPGWESSSRSTGRPDPTKLRQ